jgi:uncharacterized protein (DUF1800 family)
MSLQSSIAANRFGLGAKPGELARVGADPKEWLIQQIGPAEQPAPDSGAAFMTGAQAVAELAAYRQQRRAMKQSGDTQDAKQFFQKQRQIFVDEMAGRFALGFGTDRPFAERLVWFWSNHFTISTQNAGTASLAGAYEREAIRPHIAGKYEDMLLAVATHPAMLIYLNNAQSIGPESPAGQFAKRGLNENFGRELMELYSLGVNGGYNQADVIALANLLTGWSIDTGDIAATRPRMARFLQAQGGDDGSTESDLSGGFRYYANRHEPGAITFRGKAYPQGFAGGREAIHDLAHDPATARFVAQKLATHFIADTPPQDLVDHLESVFRNSGGDLKALAIAVVEHPAAWANVPGKMRMPVEYVTASYRLLNLPQEQNAPRQIKGAMQACRLMGHFPMAAPSPKGWPDQSQDWSGADAMLARISWARELGSRLPQNFTAADILRLGDDVLGPRVDQATRACISAAANAGEGLALLIASPEFQRR